MIKLSEELLVELGLVELPKPHNSAMLKYIYETLQQRVGMEVAGRMSDDQMDAFERFIDTGDEEGALAWLERELPTYREIVQEEFVKLKGEIAAQSTTLLEVSRTHQAATEHAER